MTDVPEACYLAALAGSVGRTAAREALAVHGSAREAFAHLTEPRLDPQRLHRQCAGAGIRLLTSDDAEYPALLRAIADPPPVLYALGDPGALLRAGVAVVGARRCTGSGREVAAALAAALTRAGLCVVSGLARGIDTAAHRATVGAGPAVAVIGSGLARPYPSSNRGLAAAIVQGGGLLLSEYPPWSGARRHHFPERNRLISGLAMGVVVVEAGEHSGSLITARMAAEQGREVCAVPGAVTSPVSRGCHRLIKQGAALVECAEDVLDALGLAARTPTCGGIGQGADPRPENDALAAILAVVEGTVTSLDQIIAASGVCGRDASAALVELELCGFVRQVPGGYIRRLLR